jgi:phosphopantetheine--protein transferase-like protein
VSDEDIVARSLEIVAIAELAPLVRAARLMDLPFTEQERSYALSKSDPERRLAARLAAKRAARAVLGGDVREEDIEVAPARGGPPRLLLSPRAAARARELHAAAALVSLTHGLTHAAAVVLLVRNAG